MVIELDFTDGRWHFCVVVAEEGEVDFGLEPAGVEATTYVRAMSKA